MTTPLPSLVERLRERDEIVSAVRRRVFPSAAPPTDYPYIVYDVITDTPTLTMAGAADNGTANLILQLTIVTKGAHALRQAYEIAEASKRALGGFTQDAPNDPIIQSVMLTDQQPGDPVRIDGEPKPGVQLVQDYSIWYSEI